MSLMDNNIIKQLTAIIILLFSFGIVEAKVQLPSLVSDGMVLQRECPVNIWGKADACEKVNIRFQRKNYEVVADEAGCWNLKFPRLKVGGPYIMSINEIEIKDIWVGDVWLCSGQSNMELPVSRVTDMFADEIASYENIQIRQFKVPSEFDFISPKNDFNKKPQWKVLNKENVMQFSALAYFYSKELHEKTGVPVGIINSSWGGTPVEAWISEESLKEFPKYINDKKRFESDAYREEIKKLEGIEFSIWNNSLYLGDPGLNRQNPWYSASYNDQDWSEVDLFSTDWATNGLNPVNGSHWFRKDINISQEWEGKEATLRLGCVVDADSVFVNGVFVGTISYMYPPRIYKIPEGVLKSGKNNVTVRLISNSGNPHFVKDKPYKIICGDEEVSLEGKWKYHLGAPMPTAPGMTFFCYKPVCLFNAMIHPLRKYAVKGVLWYQGESNVSRRNEYDKLLSTMIADWRQTFDKPEMPFYIIELADFLAKDNPARAAWAEIGRASGRERVLRLV